MSRQATIGRAALVVSAGILLSRVLGFLRNVALFALLGAEASTDLYVAAFSIPDYLFFLMAGGYLSITLVPVLTRHLATGDETEARRSFTAVFRLLALALVALTAVLALVAEPLVGLVFPEIADTARLAAVTRIALLSQVFFGLGTLLMAAQYAHRRFLVPTLAPLIYNLGIISGGLTGAAMGDPSPEAFLWGGLAGAAVGNFALQWWGARREGMRLERGVGWKHPAVAEYLALAFPLMIGQSVVALDEQWPRWFGQLAGEGAIAGLYGARQLNMLPVGVIAQAAGVAAYPFLAGLAAEGRTTELRRAVLGSATGALAVAGLAAGLAVTLSSPIVEVAYQYGRFDAADTRLVSGYLVLYALSIPFWATHQIYTRAFYARRRMWTPVVIGTLVTVVAVPALWLAVTRAGGRGVALGSTLAVGAYTVAIVAAWHRRGPSGELGRLASAAGRVAVASVLAGVTAWLVSLGLGGLGSPGPVVLLAAAVVGAALYLVAGRLLGIEAVIALLDRVRGAPHTSMSQP